jgi:hypothetical protein
MYEKVEFNELIKGERYFIRYGPYKWVIAKFSKYDNLHIDNKIELHALFKNIRKTPNWSFNGSNWWFETYQLYYKIIPNNEYKEIYTNKMKEKYDEKVLKIILKKIVNEDFEWY